MQVQQNRLPSIVGDAPTAASVARYQERLRNAYMPPVQHRDEDDDAFDKRVSAAMASAQRRVSPPVLPIIGHGSQLAAIRLQALPRVITQDSDSRQVKRRVALKARKAAESAARKETVRMRRQKVSRYAK